MQTKKLNLAEVSSETIGLLTAISIVSKRLAENLQLLDRQGRTKEVADIEGDC